MYIEKSTLSLRFGVFIFAGVRAECLVLLFSFFCGEIWIYRGIAILRPGGHISLI